MMRVDPLRLARSMLLLGIGVLIAKLIATGQMRYYMNASLDPLTAATGLVLAGLGAVELWRALRLPAVRGREHGDLDLVLTLGLVAVPLALGVVITPRALSSATLGGEPVSQLVLAFDSGAPASVAAPAPRRPIADVADLLSYLRQAGEGGVGQHVHVRGIVARSEALPPDEFVLVRYAIVHCVADAQPLGLLVMLPSNSSWDSNQWVEIDGTLASAPRGNERLVSINVEQIVPSEEPPDPYLPAY